MNADKENDPTFINKNVAASKSFGEPRKVSRFSSMLNEAMREVQTEEDNLLALNVQADEITSVVQTWVQETNDYEKAQELAQALAEEEKARRKLELLRGETEALRVAVEEKRKVKATAEEKKLRETEDEKYAKTLAEEEEKEYFRRKQELEEAGATLCGQLSEDRDDDIEHKADAKDVSSATVSPSYAAETKGNYYNSDEDEKEQGIVDDEDEDTSRYIHQIQQLETDFQIAEYFQRQFDSKLARTMKSGELAKFLAEEEKQETKANEENDISADENYAKKLAMIEERKQFMQRKRSHMKEYFEFTSRNEELVGKLWMKADAEVDNIQDALCLTVLLPNIRKMTVQFIINENGIPMVRVDAQRMIFEKKLATTENSEYIAEFSLESDNHGIIENVKEEDMYYEYSSESGLLHIFVENLLVDEEIYDVNLSDYSMKSSELMKKAGSKSNVSSAKSVKQSSSASSTNKQIGLFEKFASGISRIFRGRKTELLTGRKASHK
jgi:hypothetical protein